MIPDWMQKIEARACPCCSVSSTKKKSFVQKAISDILTFFEECLVNDAIARRKGLFQSLDPRVKVVSIIFLIFALAMTHDIHILAVMYAFIFLCAWASSIEMWFFIKRVWVFIPIFAGIIVIPILFNVFMPGDPFFVLATLAPNSHIGPISLPAEIAITYQGINVATLFVLRVACCVSAAVLLFLTTPRNLLFKALRSLKVPKVYILTLDVCYRYIFLFTDMVRGFYMAKKSRSLKVLPLVEEQKWVGSRIGYTLVKALGMSEKVHLAMVSRGFNGDIKILHQYSIKNRDYVACVCFFSIGIVMILASWNMLTI